MRSRKIIIISFLLLFITGCGVFSNDNPDLFSSARDYEMKIIKSEVNINNISFTAEKDLMVKNLLEESGVIYEFNANGKLNELDGVIATASREWNVYINGVESGLDSMVCADCIVEWRYEMINDK